MELIKRINIKHLFMKTFKPGLITIVAILATTVTLVVEASIFRGTAEVEPSVGCWRIATLSPAEVLRPDGQKDSLHIPQHNTARDVALKVLYPTQLGNCPPANIVCCFLVVAKPKEKGFMVAGVQLGNYTIDAKE